MKPLPEDWHRAVAVVAHPEEKRSAASPRQVR
jgi:hypothetical protein